MIYKYILEKQNEGLIRSTSEPIKSINDSINVTFNDEIGEKLDRGKEDILDVGIICFLKKIHYNVLEEWKKKENFNTKVQYSLF